MATHSFVEFSYPEASNFADLSGIRHDLETARTLATEHKVLLETALQGGNASMNTLDALTTTILIRYFRPFVSGIRKRLDIGEIEGITNEQLKKHEHLRAFRNKYIAHSVNAYEYNQPVARYVEERAETEGVYAVECNLTRIVAMSRAEIDDVIELTTQILHHLDGMLEIEKKNLLQKIRSIPFDEFLSRNNAISYSPHNVNINKPRHR